MNSKIVLFSLLVIFFTISSCKKDTADAPAFSAKIGDHDWSANLTKRGELYNGILTVYGASVSGELFNVTVFGKTAGTYTLSLSLLTETCGATYKSSLSQSVTDLFVSESGEVIVTNYDTIARKVSGTFSFKLYRSLTDSLIVTNGIFSNINYSVKN